MARDYEKTDVAGMREDDRRRSLMLSVLTSIGALGLASTPLLGGLDPMFLFGLGALPAMAFANHAKTVTEQNWLEREREAESARRGGRRVLGTPPDRTAISDAIEDAKRRGKKVLDKYLVGFELETGRPLWVDEDDMCTHAAVFAKTGVGKTLWLESLIFQQMARGRASGCTFIDAKRDSATLAHIILMAIMTGRIEDLIVIDPFDPVHSYNFVMTYQRADVKARKVLRAGLPPTSDASTTKHYDRLAADSIYRMVRAMESFGLAWSIKDIGVSLSAFNLAYPHLRNMLYKIGARQAMVELGHLASSYRSIKGVLDLARITDNLRGIASELNALAGSDAGKIFTTKYTDLVLTDAILRGKIIYFMLPRLEEAESAARMVKVFREDLEVSIGEITSSRIHNLEDPHLVIIDEGSSTFGPTWANLFELARRGRFSLLFGAQSAGGLQDETLGLSEQFYERVMANVNLKVMMRIGDNKTATEMTEWIGKVTSTKKTVGAGITSVRSQNALRGGFDFEAKRTGGETQNVTFSEDEEDLVSMEELKHEMSAEKGLAWFDLGDGRIVKGRSFWFNSELPDTWEGREFLIHPEHIELDEIGLADWVDEEILVQEQKETSQRFAPKKEDSDSSSHSSGPQANRQPAAQQANSERVDDGSPFKINLMPRGARPRGVVRAFNRPADEAKEEAPAQQSAQNAQAAPAQAAPKRNDEPRKQSNSASSAAANSQSSTPAPPAASGAAKPSAQPQTAPTRTQNDAAAGKPAADPAMKPAADSAASSGRNSQPAERQPADGARRKGPPERQRQETGGPSPAAGAKPMPTPPAAPQPAAKQSSPQANPLPGAPKAGVKPFSKPVDPKPNGTAASGANDGSSRKPAEPPGDPDPSKAADTGPFKLKRGSGLRLK